MPLSLDINKVNITTTTNTNVVDIALVIGIVNDMILKIPHMVFSTIIIVIVNFSDFFNTFTDWCYKNCLTFGVDFLSKESSKKWYFLGTIP